MKRMIDVVGAAIGLAVTAVPLALVAVVIRLTMGGPVLLRSTRVGRHGREFTCYKLRTMLDLRDAEGALLPDGERLTRLGRTLRNWSVDELPQAWNVLTGSMSLVGPRPLLPEYMSRYSAEQARRHEVKPGITGWMQVNGRNALPWERKLELDVWYVDHHSVALDLRILVRTVATVVRGDGVSAPGHATMPAFDPSRES